MLYFSFELVAKYLFPSDGRGWLVLLVVSVPLKLSSLREKTYKLETGDDGTEAADLLFGFLYSDNYN